MISTTMSEVLQFVQENDVKFIRLAFCDLFGNQKNISIMPGELPRAFETGISFDASALKGFLHVDESDLFLRPDPSTLSVLPWRPAQGRVVRLFCDVTYPDGRPFEGCGRAVLRRAVEQAAAMGYACKAGTECEFYLFETDEQGSPTRIPLDNGGYFDIAPRDKGENIRREICLDLEEMNLRPESSHHEQGPGQNEIDFRYDDILVTADNLITFQSAVKAIAARNGLFASFLPKPLAESSGSGLHVNLSISRNGTNLFRTDGSGHSREAESFMAGILEKTPEITVFLNPLTNSYARLGRQEAPGYVTWSHRNRSQLVRIPASRGPYSRMELRSPDPACNPYLAFALLLLAGLDGIQRSLPLCPPTDMDLYSVHPADLAGIAALPRDLGEALDAAEGSRFVRDALPAALLQDYLQAKRAEWDGYLRAEDKEEYETRLYFTQV